MSHPVLCSPGLQKTDLKEMHIDGYKLVLECH